MRKIGPLCGPISAIVYNAILKLLADKAAEILAREMENACLLSVPLTADAGIGDTWYDAKK